MTHTQAFLTGFRDQWSKNASTLPRAIWVGTVVCAVWSLIGWLAGEPVDHGLVWIVAVAGAWAAL